MLRLTVRLYASRRNASYNYICDRKNKGDRNDCTVPVYCRRRPPRRSLASSATFITRHIKRPSILHKNFLKKRIESLPNIRLLVNLRAIL